MNVIRLAAACFAVLVARAAVAQCGSPPAIGEYWTMTYPDVATRDGVDYDTTFRLIGPCKVWIDTEFVVTASATDNTYALRGSVDRTVGSGWKITDRPDPVGATTTVLDYGTLIQTTGGEWVTTVSTAYQGIPVNHTIGFSFTPGPPTAHFWKPSLISSLTVDPYPDPPPADPPPAVTPPLPDPDPSGGCGTVGTSTATLALLGLIALMRRRMPSRGGA